MNEAENILLGSEGIENLAVELAQSYIVEETARNLFRSRNTRFPKWLMTRMNKNYENILAVYKSISSEVGESANTSPTAEWLLDNFYIIEEQVKDIRVNCANRHYFSLPVLKNESLKNYPRTYALALELVKHTDSRVDEKTLERFLQAYQSKKPLYMGELWAFTGMLRIALVEQVSRICGELYESFLQRKEAEEAARLIIDAIASGEDHLLKTVGDLMGTKKDFHPSYTELLIHLLRKKGRKTSTAVGLIDKEMAERGYSLEEVINQEHQAQAGLQVSMGNCITSLRMVATVDWNEIFESLSHVEAILRRDPAGIYGQMDFESRDYYRHAVEKISRAFKVTETEVAEKVLRCAEEANKDTGFSKEKREDPVNHVGYYLISDGRKNLEQQLGARNNGAKAISGILKEHPYLVYFGSIMTITLLIMSVILGFVAAKIMVPALLLVVGLILLVPVSDISINIVNFIVSHACKPVVLPKLELRDGIGRENSTMVIIPTLLPNTARVQELLEKLEVYYLANKDDNLYYALVGDFKDSDVQEEDEDSAIVERALKGIQELNRRYGKDRTIFYFFHRQRQYNAAQGQWMGWERKRGAIVEFNDLIMGAEDTSYKVLSVESGKIPSVKYIITLDADTNLHMGAARRLIGTMSHPLNKPVIDRDKGIVVRGHGILQPRIGVSIDSANKTLFSRIFAGQGGIDPYTTAVSDVYQDLFGEGIFTGKGIYHLETFQTLLRDRIPENSILSHDLLEGSYLRAGLVTDIELIDGYPARYNSFSMRQHRWVRGDWQLLPWLAGKVRDRVGQLGDNPLNALSKWKIVDNLRRSMLNPSLCLLILLGFAVLPGNGLFWLALAALVIAFPTISYLLGGLLAKNHHLMEGTKAQTVITGVRASIYQAILLFSFIAYQAYLMADAILRTLGRVYITKKNLLEWIPAADLEALLKNDLATFYRKMLVSPLLGALVLLGAVIGPNTSVEIFGAGIVFGFWVAAPYIAFRVSRDYQKKKEQLDEKQLLELRRLARKTWAYFEDMASREDNYLPPDNYQVEPPNGKAHRTSPTNIGLHLVSVLAARDFGYIGTMTMLEMIDSTLSTVEKLEKWEGHLYNWYDTRNLRVLRPRYVSTVDSGNFVGYLMVLEEGLKEYLNKPLVDPAFAEGLIDTINLFNGELEDASFSIDKELLEVYKTEAASDVQSWLDALRALESQLSEGVRAEKIETSQWGKKLLLMIRAFKKEAEARREDIFTRIEDLLGRVRILINNTRFAPLFNRKRQLFSIGYNVEEGALTKSYYDLLASEARLASYIAVARGEVDNKHWFRLGRKLTQVEGQKGLVSWSGTMFEYFMPLLIMKNFESSLLDGTYSFVLKAQKKYGKERNTPWGVSESAYYAFDVDLNYQYKAFGLPELGFKRGLGNELVVAPYATVLALTTDPVGTVENLTRLKKDGLEGTYGFYEAIDYTLTRSALRGKSSVVKNFMVHHQGMIFLALANFFVDNIMQNRFHANPVIKSAEFLLQERMPLKVSITKEHKEEYKVFKGTAKQETNVIRKFGVPQRILPKVHLLSNGSYSVMVTEGGSGYSKNNDMAVNRWRGTLQGNNAGFFIYVQNINSNNFWSAAFEPCNVEPEDYQVTFSSDKAEYFRVDGNIETHTQIVVSPEENAEIRTVTLTNNSNYHRVLEVTSYLETVLTHSDADLAHPAFSNLFVTTEYVPQYECLLAVRKPRSAEQKPVYAMHTVAVEGEVVGTVQYETDRAKFIGRNRALDAPRALDVDQPLSNTVGAVLDPIMSIRRRVRIAPGHSAKITYTLGVAENRERALQLADQYRDIRVCERAFELAWNRSQIETGFLDIEAGDMEVYLNMVSHILFSGPLRRKYANKISQNEQGQPGLWPFGISGDLPILAVDISDKDQLDMVYDLLKAHELWRMKGLKVDLAFLVEDEGGYVQPLQEGIRDAISASHARDLMNRSGGVYLLNGNIMTEQEKNLIYAAAKLVLKGGEGSIEEQLAWKEFLEEDNRGAVKASKAAEEEVEKPYSSPAPRLELEGLQFFNGFGGFSEDGREYVIHLRDGQHTPAPWINVIANPRFGFNVTESGAGYTWAENSRENKLTPWYNDPVTDLQGEAFYLRDEEHGYFWSITPMPVREKEDYVIRHGRGYTSFEHVSHGVEQKLTQFAALEEPVKISLIKLNNRTDQTKKLSITFYMRPVLGVNDKVSAPFIITSEEEGVLLIKNPYNSDFLGRVAFLSTSEVLPSFTGDGSEFMGLNGNLGGPAAMYKDELSGRVGAGFDPCGAMRVKVDLKPGEVREVVFLLGQEQEGKKAIDLAKKFRNLKVVAAELARVKEYWREKLEVLQVETPDKSMDLMLNGWLQYQVIACRLWSRAAFYQSGGAYGYRDQLQDVMATVYTWPELTRQQILLHSAHQFIEGDVQHWWHPGVNKGIRTRYSDDYLWLPYVTADYIEATGDWSILDEVTGFLEDDPLPVEEDERYNIPRVSQEKDTVYIHCIKAIENGLNFGDHGLPLMGSGDWNDGMNKVGNQGKGESVWLGWFLYKVLQRFIPICEQRQDLQRSEKYAAIAEKLAEAIEANAWDGSWYRRAYFDDGTPLGSAENSECRIDAIAQSWSVISGVGRPHRAEEAMQAVDKHLVDREAGIIKLLAPPFDQGDLQPGYIKGYVPGVRENGGQYTHAAVWTVLAFAKLGQGDKVGELFSLINPINHSLNRMEALRYKVEPYVVAADVYAVHPNRGRGGWSWYTGAAGWMYRVGIAHILGFKKSGDYIYLDPCIPKDWRKLRVNFKSANSLYRIHIMNPDGVNKGIKSMTMDGQPVDYININDDGQEHIIEVIMGKTDEKVNNRGKIREVEAQKWTGSKNNRTIPAAKGQRPKGMIP